MMHKPVLYLETSIFGFYLDDNPHNFLRREAVRELFRQVDLGILSACVSPLTIEELSGAHGQIRSVLLGLVEQVEKLRANEDEVDRLTEIYVSEGIIARPSAADARHAAYAAVSGASTLASLNLKHLANEWAERRINSVNLREGYPMIRIRTPEEVVRYED
jgi:hypothetical protein